MTLGKSVPLEAPILRDATHEFLTTYPKALRSQTAAVFAGAGLSRSAGFVNWRELLRDIASNIGLDVDREHDLISLAQYHVNERGGRGVINQQLVDLFTTGTGITENHKILARLPIHTFWTTNYDTLVESALTAAGRNPDVKITKESLATSRPDSDVVVYKMHGDVGSAHDAVLTKDDYETYNEKRQLFSTKLQGDLVSKTFLFIGFSFDDPNLQYILGRIRVLLGESLRPHYCILRRPDRLDFAQPGVSDEEIDRALAYAQVHEEHRVKDLRRYGIHAVLIDDYAEITGLLQRVEARYLRHSVLISGSAVEYSPRTPERAKAFIRSLSGALAQEFTIVSGFGEGVGTDVLNGVLDLLDARHDPHLDGYLALRPFPQWDEDPSRLHARWAAYRERMAALAGTALFLFGNKWGADGKIELADGVRSEFEIATRKGLRVVPVGATGYTAQELWNQVMGDFDSYYPDMPELRSEFAKLGDATLDDATLVHTLRGIIRAIRDA